MMNTLGFDAARWDSAPYLGRAIFNHQIQLHPGCWDLAGREENLAEEEGRPAEAGTTCK